MAREPGVKIRQRISNLFSGCFGKKKATIHPFAVPEDIDIPKRWIKLPKFKDAITPYTPRRKKVVPRNDSFTKALRKEHILAPGSTTADHPILDICLGFNNEELAYSGPRIVHRSYKRTHWDRILSKRKGLRRMASYSLNCNEPIVDDLPASLWMQCLEPTLSVLVKLSAMKHRRSNLNQKLNTRRLLNALVMNTRDRHGDHSREVHNFLGPQLVLREQMALAPTDEVRPSRILEFGGPSRITVHVMTEPSDRMSSRNRNRNILTRPAQDPYEIEEEEPLAYVLPDDAEESDFSTDISSDSDSDLSDEDLNYIEENFNINATTNYAIFQVKTKSKLSQSPEPSGPTILKTPFSRLDTRTYYWSSDLHDFEQGGLNPEATDDIRSAQHQWTGYIRKLVYHEPTNEEAQHLHRSLSVDPAYRRVFLNDIVLHIDQLDKSKMKERERQLESKMGRVGNGLQKSSKFEITISEGSSESVNSSPRKLSKVRSHLSVRSDSDVNLEDLTLTPLPDSPKKVKHLQCEDFVICNVIPFGTWIHHGTSASKSVEFINYTEKTGTCIRDRTRKYNARKDDNKSTKHEAVVMVTDNFVIPETQTPIREKYYSSKKMVVELDDMGDDDALGTSILTLYA